MQPCCVIPIKQIKRVRSILERNHVWDSSRKMQKSDDNVRCYLPVIFETSSRRQSVMRALQAEGISFDIQDNCCLPLKSKRTQPEDSLKDACRSWIKSNGQDVDESTFISSIPNSWEKHGDLVLFPSQAFDGAFWSAYDLDWTFWKAVAESLGCIRVAKKSKVNPDGFRTPQVELMFGSDGVVIQKDNGLIYSYDVTKCMFSAGNISEKIRVGQFDCRNEIVVDLYAGIGYFTLPYLKHAKAEHVHACEWNPDALCFLRKNLQLNGLEHHVSIHEGDNRQVMLKDLADRVNLGLIPSSEDGWPVAVQVLKQSGGFLHIHQNVTSKTDSSTTSENIETRCDRDLSLAADLSESMQQGNSDASLLPSSDSHLMFVDQHSWGKLKPSWKSWSLTTARRIQTLLIESKDSSLWRTYIQHVEHVKSYAPHVDHLVLDLKCSKVQSNQIAEQ